MTEKYTLRRTTDSDYQFEKPDGTVMVTANATNVAALPSDPDQQPSVPADIAEPIVTYCEDNGHLHEWRVIQWIGVRYLDDR